MPEHQIAAPASPASASGGKGNKQRRARHDAGTADANTSSPSRGGGAKRGASAATFFDENEVGRIEQIPTARFRKPSKNPLLMGQMLV